MAGLSRVVLVGNLTRDPELRHTQSEMAVCELSVAVNSRERRDGEWQDYVSYFDVIVFGVQGESCARHLAKGAPVGIDGRLKQERWDDRETGNKRSRVRILADNVQFLPRGGKGSSGDNGSRDAVPSGEFAVPQETFSVPTSTVDDDIPF